VGIALAQAAISTQAGYLALFVLNKQVTLRIWYPALALITMDIA